MKQIMQFVISASLVAACVVQVRSRENRGWIVPSASSPCCDEDTAVVVRIPPARPGGSRIEKTATRVIFKKKHLYADDQDPGLRPNTKEMIDLYLDDLSSLTPESLLNAFGFQEFPQGNAIISMLAGLLLGLAKGQINISTVAVFLRIFEVETYEATNALKAIAEVIKETKFTDNPTNANGYFLCTDILDYYYQQSESASPISKQSWAELGCLMDHVVNGKRDEAEKIVHFLALQDEALLELSTKSPADQVNFVQTLAEDVVNFGKFLEYAKYARQAED